MFVGRKEDGTIYGTSTVPQAWAKEELPDDHPDVVAFRERKPPQRTPEQKLAALGLTVDDLKQLVGAK